MRIFLASLIFVSLSNCALGQIIVEVKTDRSVYSFGDTVKITILAYNPNNYSVNLNFTSSCQASYSIDNFDFKYHMVCALVLTNRTIPAGGTITWDSFKYPILNHTPLSPGSHWVIGEVIGYGKSLPLQISVSGVTSIKEIDVTNYFFLAADNYPNPFKGVTWIPLTIKNAGRIRINIFNSSGSYVRTISDEYYSPGSYLVKADLNDLSDGLYFCSIECNGKVLTLKFILSK